MSVSGMVVAGLTFPSQLFSSGVVAYTTISQVRNMGSSFGTWYWLFKFQESRYIIWGMSHNACSPGGLNESQMPNIVYQTVVQSLVQINTVLEDKNNLCKRYGLKDIGEIEPVEVPLIRRESMRQQNMVKRLQKSSSLFRKVQWAVQDQSRFAELVQQLTELINTLYEMLPVTGGPLLGDTIAAETLADTLINRGWGGVEGLQQTTHPHLQELREMERAMNTAAHREATENPTLVQHFTPSRNLLLNMQQLDFFDSRSIPNSAPHIRSWARPKQNNPFSGADLVVEWRKYDPQRGREAQKATLQKRIEALVMMLKEKPRTDSFRVLDCIGYFEDNSDTRFGLTFRLPSHYSPQRDLAPTTLFDTISAHPENAAYLGDRFRLAYILAESVHALHATGWLHKSISSHNILLLQQKNSHPAPSGNQQRPPSLQNPYFTGFATSRPDDPNEYSSQTAADREMALYCHPDVQGSESQRVAGYRAIYDIYSLGLVLIEIGTWRTLTRWSPKVACSNLEFKKRLLDKVVPFLGASMGENYMIAVRKCLEGSFERLAGFSEDEYNSADYKNNVRLGLLWEVVTILRDCRA